MTPSPARNGEILDALRSAITLPKYIVSLKLTMSVDDVPCVECTFHPTAREAAELDAYIGGAPITRRFELRP